MVTGSSWTTAGTLGVAFVGMAKVMGLSEEVEAGAVICGAYFGDKMIPLSETTILVPSLVGGGLTVGRHIRNMFWTAGPTLRISLVIFLLIGLNAEPHGEVSTDQAREILGNAFNITPLNLLPLILLVVFTVKRVPPFLAILGSALFAGSSSASRSGPRSRRSSTNPDWGRSRLDQGDLRLDGDRLRQQDGLFRNRPALLPRWDGELADDGLARPRCLVVRGDPRARRISRAAVAAGSEQGEVAGPVDRVCQRERSRPERGGGRPVRRRRPPEPHVSQRVRAAPPRAAGAFSRGRGLGNGDLRLGPWNTCGAYISGVLGVPTASYLPYCYFNFLSPILDVVYGFLGFKVPRVDEAPGAKNTTAQAEAR
jgi:NhaC family Na+:H+ antiporter